MARPRAAGQIGAMKSLPTRAQALRTGSASASLGGALYGVAEAARVAVGGRLWLSDGNVLGLFAVGALSCALLGALAALPLAALPARPLGRTAWSGFLAGFAAPLLARVGVKWFSDPPPFTEPFFLQGNPVAFLGILALVVGVAVVLYQAARGAQRVAGAALALVVALGGWVIVAQSGPGAADLALPAGAPNVLVVTLDTTRADHFGAYGNDRVDTRYFDQVAREGAMWTNASAIAAVTGPSHASMFSGAGPWDHGVLLNGIPIPDDRPLLSELLHDHGWQTAGFVSSYVLDGDKGFGRGFEVYDDDFSWLKGSGDLVIVQLADMVRRRFNPEEDLQRRGGDTVDAALSWLEGREGAWYLWVHLFDAHGPYEPPPPFDTRYYQGDPRDPSNTSMAPVKNVAAYLKESIEGITDLRWVLAQYEGEVSYADAQLGRLLAAVDPQNTLVVVIADHGESLGEHDVWFNHGDDVYETSVHVPFALRWPGRVAAGQRVTQPFEGTDLAPTLLDLVGVAIPEAMTGASAASLVGAGKGKGRIEARSMCFDREANLAAREAGEIDKPKFRMVGLRGPSTRYVQRETGREPEFFDLSSDPKGLVDLYPQKQWDPLGAELLGILAKNAGVVLGSNATERSTAEVSDEERARLEALGYLDPTTGE